MTNTYKSPIIASVDGGYEDLRNTPFSIGTYKIVFNTQFEPPTAPGTTAFNRRFQLTTPLRGVKKIRLLYARFPQVGESAVGVGDGTDALISIQIREFKGKYTMAEKIVSPGVFTSETDLSFLPVGIGEIGAAIIGPTSKGPSFVPVMVESFSEFEIRFGGLNQDV